MLGRATGAVGATTALVLAVFAASAGAAGPIVPSSAADVDYHAEGQIIGGNISIQTDRAHNQGDALTVCDPDPRAAPHERPDTCSFGIPAGAGRDLVNFGRHIPDADESPNNAFTPAATDTRENFNGKAGIDTHGPIFVGDFYDDDDMNFRLTPRTLDAYLAPNADPNNRWRRFCGTGIVDDFHHLSPAAPFSVGQTRKFIVEIWDADHRHPSDHDGGNQDYWVIDILKPGSLFDTSKCVNVDAGGNPAPPLIPPAGEPGGPGGLGGPGAGADVAPQAPTAIAGSLSPLVLGASAPARIAFANAAARGPGGCVARATKVAVSGANIQSVEFRVNGRLLRRVTRRDATGSFRATVSLSRLTRVSNRVTARVVFRAATGAAPRTLPLTVRRCPRPIATSTPAFTG